MDNNLIFSPSLSSSSMLSFTQQTPAIVSTSPADLLQHKLQFIVENSPDQWAYVIFWQKMTCDQSNRSHFLCLDGYFKNHNKSQENVIYNIERELMMDGGDLEWFYATSFNGGDGLPRKEYYNEESLVWLTGYDEIRFSNLERAKEAGSHGIHTFVAVPIQNGVIELGSSDVIKPNWDFTNRIKSVFDPVNQTGSDCKPVGNPQSESEKRRRKKKGAIPTTDSEIPVGISHVEAERLRREKLNRRFYDLRAVVPNVSGMDKASLLHDAVSFIKNLNSKLEYLETQLKIATATTTTTTTTSEASESNGVVFDDNDEFEVEVKVVGEEEAVIRVQMTENVNHPVAVLMSALMELRCRVIHASGSRVGEVMVLDVVVLVPDGLRVEDKLWTTLVRKIRSSITQV